MYTSVVTPPQQVGVNTITVFRPFATGGPRCYKDHARDAVYFRSFGGMFPEILPPWMRASSFDSRWRQPRLVLANAPIALCADVGSSSGNMVETVGIGGLLARGGADTTTAAALGTVPLGVILLATGWVSTKLAQRTKAGAVIGAPLISFGTLCLLSNLGLAPSTHAVYDLCWSFLLPLSLAIIILGNPVSAEGDRQLSDPARPFDRGLIDRKKITRGSIGPVRKVGLAFVVGAAGSIIGVLTAFLVATSFTGAGGALTLPRETAAQVGGAVTATYIGGSVNLFAVAAAVGLVGATSTEGASLLGALAASDVFLMALYFSGLVAANKTPSLRRLFPAEARALGRCSGVTTARPSGFGTGKKRRFGTELDANGGLPLYKWKSITTVSLLGLGSAICFAGNAVALRSPLPGTSAMAVTLLSVAVTRLLVRRAPSFQSSLSREGPTLAAVLLNVFFGSVGAAGRWTQVVGIAPAIFAFASLALILHAVVMATGAALLNKCFGAGLGIDDLVVASNANIGGPSTAATFAGLIGEDELVVPAAVWGTVGYAIATTLGVGVWAALR